MASQPSSVEEAGGLAEEGHQCWGAWGETERGTGRLAFP